MATRVARGSNRLPLVVHLVYRLDFGGLETVLVECVNRIPPTRYRHAVVCLAGYTDFARKITQPGVEIYSLDKRPGLGLGTHVVLWKLLRRLRPTILHTYNLATVEYAFTAALAGVPVRVHAEHGRDLSDPQGLNQKHNMLRRLLIPFIDTYVPVSLDLRRWLGSAIGVPDTKNLLINNGVDTQQFCCVAPAAAPRPNAVFVVGTVGRIQDIKNHKGLVEAFLRLRERLPHLHDRLRLHIIGDGPLMSALRAQVAAAGLDNCVWLPGARTDVATCMAAFSVFVLPSFAEGTPVTLLEAMACGLPVVASRVGGIPDVIGAGCGVLVEPSDHDAMAAAMAAYCEQPALAALHGAAGRQIVEQRYSMAAMLGEYTFLYDRLCESKSAKSSKARKKASSCAE